MTDEAALAKTTRINLLFDFYAKLLTEKQQLFLKLYFHDDYSLGEIAAEFAISRQAVYEHIKRAEAVLEDYEEKLQLLTKHEKRLQIFVEMAEAASVLPESEQRRVHELLAKWNELE